MCDARAHLKQLFDPRPLGLVPQQLQGGTAVAVLCLWVGVALAEQAVDHVHAGGRRHARRVERGPALDIVLADETTRLCQCG